MTDIIKEILKDLPAKSVSEAAFEGANIVLYTKDKDFFLDNKGAIRNAVNNVKKRVELRPDPSMCMAQEEAEKEIRKIIPSEAAIDQIIFDPERSMVVIEAEKPGLAIGKQGFFLHEIRAKTTWVPLIRRKPAIRSKLIENIRGVLYQNSDYRRKFLDKVGHRIYDGWIREKKHEWIRLSYLGGGRQVGRSSILLQTPESRVLMDVGVNVADDRDPYPILEAPEFDIKQLDAVIISHAHLDHCGFVPYLFKYGYRGPIYCTEPTRDVMSLLTLDYVKIARGEGRDPIYNADDIREMVKHTITLEYGEVTDITPDIRITLYNSGHIIGSSMVHLHIGNGLHNLVYGADMKCAPTRLLEPAISTFPRCETFMCESTYGGKDCALPPRADQEKHIQDVITETIKQDGKVLIPVLGVGRAQEVMVVIDHMVRTKKIPDVPIFVDGMVWDVTAIHTAYPEFLNNTIRKQIFHKDENPFLNDKFREVASVKERKVVIEETGSCIILATSGMLVGGPSVEYLRNLSDNPKNSLMFVSYQGEGSLGKRIQRGEREIMFQTSGKPEVCPIKMGVHTIEGFSGHAGRKELMDFMKRIEPKPKRVLVNHGESSRCLDLASSIHKQNRIETGAPRNLEAVRIK